MKFGEIKMEFIFKKVNYGLTDDEIKQDVLNVYNKKGDNLFTFKYYNQNGKYGKKAIVNHFGTWNNLLLMLNIPITK